jgi:DNA-binding NarL/FixJ family response regulator
MKVLVIDDSPLVREHLLELLAEIPGISLITPMDHFSCSRNAIRCAEPDVVILDIQLQNTNGIEILEELKSSESAWVKIMLTAFPNPLYRQRCLEAGAHYFLDKTVELQSIVDVLESLIAQQTAKVKS